jgi:hypothetical protein
MGTPIQRVASSLAAMPLVFEENRGQAKPGVDFLCRSRGFDLLLAPSELTFLLREKASPAKDSTVRSVLVPGAPHRVAVAKIRFVGANAHSKMSGTGKQAMKSNYFIGRDPRRWRTDISNYSSVVVKSLYPGVDAVYHGSGKQLEYDLNYAPHVRPDLVRLAFDGFENVAIDSSGDLVLSVAGGEIRQAVPRVYQDVKNGRQTIAAHWVLRNRKEAHIALGLNYDRRQPVVVDPIVSYATYLGGTLEDTAAGIAVGRDGSAYVTGFTESLDFPVLNPFQGTNHGGESGADAFIAKIDPQGTGLAYATYLGGSGDDIAHDIAVDKLGCAYVVGETTSIDFPVVNPLMPKRGRRNAFVTKLSPSGMALDFSTFLGGSTDPLGGNKADTFGTGIALDDVGAVYVIGYTNSSDFPTVGAFQSTIHGSVDAFITKIDAAGFTILYSSYLGGSDYDYPSAVAVDRSRNAYITGFTMSVDFPLQAPFQSTNRGKLDGFVAKVDAFGSSLLYSSYLGGSDNDNPNSIAVDSGGNAYVTGYTQSTDFPTVAAFQNSSPGGYEVFVSKITPSGSGLVYSTYLGGSGGDVGSRVAVDASDNAYIVGLAGAVFPTRDSLQSYAGGGDAFVTRLDFAGIPSFSTWLGGSGYDRATGVALNGSGGIFVAGFTNSTDFPTKQPIQSQYGGGYFDVFVAKISDPPPSPVTNASYFTLTPCRILDTRNAPGPFGGPSLLARDDRKFQVTGACGIPAGASAVSLNVTVTQPTAPGDLRLVAAGTPIPLPLTSTINYRPGQSRAGNAILQLGVDGGILVHVDQSDGSVDLILDVNGYFQ